MPARTSGMTIIAILAIVQGVLGILRALHWFDAGSDLLGQGLLILPLVGMVAFARGALVFGIALLYVVFAAGMFVSKGWARPLGLVVAVVNILLVLSVLIQGESLARAMFWIVVPVIILWYLLSPAKNPAPSISPEAK